MMRSGKIRNLCHNGMLVEHLNIRIYNYRDYWDIEMKVNLMSRVWWLRCVEMWQRWDHSLISLCRPLEQSVLCSVFSVAPVFRSLSFWSGDGTGLRRGVGCWPWPALPCPPPPHIHVCVCAPECVLARDVTNIEIHLFLDGHTHHHQINFLMKY